MEQEQRIRKRILELHGMGELVWYDGGDETTFLVTSIDENGIAKDDLGNTTQLDFQIENFTTVGFHPGESKPDYYFPILKS